MIDWFTICAQALNFLILVWLMKRFLYKPILSAIDAREKKIAASLADGEAKKADALKQSEAFRKKNEEFDQQRAALLTGATDDANAERTRLFETAKKNADDLTARRADSMRMEAANLNQAIGDRARREVFMIARKALADLADTSLEKSIADVFIRRMGEVDAGTKALIGKSFKSSAEPAVVRSAFDLPADQRAAVQKSLSEAFSADVPLRFETTQDLIGGIELSTYGQKIGWNIDGYLKSLEDGVGLLVAKKP